MPSATYRDVETHPGGKILSMLNPAGPLRSGWNSIYMSHTYLYLSPVHIGFIVRRKQSKNTAGNLMSLCF